MTRLRRLRHSSLLALTVATALFGTACADATTQPPAAVALPTPALAADGVERWTERRVVDLSDSYYVLACSADGQPLEDPEDGELIRMEGVVAVRETLVRDAAGNTHLRWHAIGMGVRGVGVTSGEEFRGREVDHGTYNSQLAGAGGQYHSTRELVGRDSGRRFTMVVTGHYRFAADGSLLVDRHEVETRCRA